MRVISGLKKGTKLYTPDLNNNIRPTTDRIKEDIFNIINFHIEGSNCLDLFCGTGSIGIEFLSRHGKHCDFVEQNKDNYSLVEKNLKKVQFENYSLYNMDALDFINFTTKKYDIIFLDPPYNMDFENKVLIEIINNDILTHDGIVIVEHSLNTIISETSPLETFKIKKYKKTTAITFLDKRNDNID